VDGNTARNVIQGQDRPGCPSNPHAGLQESERFQAKWRPVRVKKTRQIKNLEPRFDSIETEKALARTTGAFLLCQIQVVTADEPDQFLGMHFMAVRSASALLRHRAVGAIVRQLVRSLLRRLGGCGAYL
jgi:hypothetical protein